MDAKYKSQEGKLQIKNYPKASNEIIAEFIVYLFL